MSLANKFDIPIKKSKEYTVTNVTVPWSQLQLEPLKNILHMTRSQSRRQINSKCRCEENAKRIIKYREISRFIFSIPDLICYTYR